MSGKNRRQGCVAREGGKRASDADGIGIQAVPPGWEKVGKVGLAAGDRRGFRGLRGFRDPSSSSPPLRGEDVCVSGGQDL